MTNSAFYLAKLLPKTSYAPEWVVGGRNIQHQSKNIGGYQNSNVKANTPTDTLFIGKNTLPADTYLMEIKAIYDDNPTYIPVEAFKEGYEYSIHIDYYSIVDINDTSSDYNFSDSEFQMFGYFPKNFRLF